MEELDYIVRLEKLLDERLAIAIDTDKRMGNDGDNFLPNNPDYIYYKGMIESMVALGYEYCREEYKHTVFER